MSLKHYLQASPKDSVEMAMQTYQISVANDGAAKVSRTSSETFIEEPVTKSIFS